MAAVVVDELAAVFARRCLECHALLDTLACPNHHQDAIKRGRWEVVDIVHRQLIAVVGCTVVRWTEYGERLFLLAAEVHGRDLEGFVPGPQRIRMVRHARESKLWGHIAGACPWCHGEFRRVAYHLRFCARRPARHEVAP